MGNILTMIHEGKDRKDLERKANSRRDIHLKNQATRVTFLWQWRVGNRNPASPFGLQTE